MVLGRLRKTRSGCGKLSIRRISGTVLLWCAYTINAGCMSRRPGAKIRMEITFETSNRALAGDTAGLSLRQLRIAGVGAKQPGSRGYIARAPGKERGG